MLGEEIRPYLILNSYNTNIKIGSWIKSQLWSKYWSFRTQSRTQIASWTLWLRVSIDKWEIFPYNKTFCSRWCLECIVQVISVGFMTVEWGWTGGGCSHSLHGCSITLSCRGMCDINTVISPLHTISNLASLLTSRLNAMIILVR